MKRVLIVNKYFDAIGGIEEVVRNLASIQDENISITVLALGKKSIEKSLWPHVEIKIIPYTYTMFGMPISFSYLRVLWNEIAKADVVHFHSPFPLAEWSFVLFRMLRTFRAKVLVTFHADIIRQKFFIRLHHWFMKRLLRTADVVVVTSLPLLKETPILAQFANKAQVIPLGVKEPKGQVIHGDFTYALFVGRLVYYKGLSYVIKALQGTNIRLIIVGDGPLKNELTKQAESESVLDNIIWKDHVTDEELIALYTKASVLVFPSVEITEALGLVQAEAMSYGLPVINTTLPTGVPWVARDGMEAITVPIRNADSLRNALISLQDVALRKKLGENGKKRYEELFTIKRMKEKYIEIYKSL